MPEHPVILIAEETAGQGGNGLELYRTRSGRGGLLTCWLPSLDAARAVARVGKAAGLDVRSPVQHLNEIGDTSYHGYQVTTYIPNALLETARDAMTTPQALAAGAPVALGTGEATTAATDG